MDKTVNDVYFYMFVQVLLNSKLWHFHLCEFITLLSMCIMCYTFIHMHCGCMMYGGWDIWLFSYSETGKASHQPNIDYHSFLLPDGLRLSLSTLLESSALDLVSCGHNLLP